MRRFARWLAENPYLVLAASLAITVWLGFYAWQIKIESALKKGTTVRVRLPAAGETDKNVKASASARNSTTGVRPLQS